MNETGGELPPQEVTEAKEEIRAEQPKEGLFSRFKRRVLGQPQNTTPDVPKELTFDELQQEKANLIDIRNRGGKDFNTPETRAKDDARLLTIDTLIASRTPKPEIAEQPTIVPEVPQEQPAEEPKAA